MPTKTESIGRLLEAKTIPDLAGMYTPDMECQVNVIQGSGERIDGEYMGRKWVGWTDGITTWKPFRIPYKAMSDPEFTDTKITFDLEQYAEGIGMTGWDWKNRVSKWVAYDIDHIINHKAGHTSDTIQQIIEITSQIKWVTIRKSTSGKGAHLYVFVKDVPTKNHVEHAALARAILGKLSAIAAYDFESKVDVCGGNMWVWHRKMQGTDGLTLIKAGEVLQDLPINWKDHISVVSNRSRRVLHKKIEESTTTSLFNELCGQRMRVALDSEHKRLLDYFENYKALWWWDPDNHLLVTHTIHLKEAFVGLDLKGFFETVSSGKERGTDYNCFAFPLSNGAWSVRRYGLGVEEHASWNQDSSGWTQCFFNRAPTFDSACRAHGGLEDPNGGYLFRDGTSAKAAALLFGVHVQMGSPQLGRRCTLKKHRDGRLLVEVEHDSHDSSSEMQSWLQKKDVWIKIYNTATQDPTEPEIISFDETVRHLTTSSGEDSGWMIHSEDSWKNEPLTHIKVALSAIGQSSKDVNTILGSAVFKPWKITNKPFQPEYPGDREWNREAAQLRYKPTQAVEGLIHPHWDLILNHCGTSLDNALAQNKWAQENGIIHGSDYLRCWIAAMFQQPLKPLPYLFLYGPQNSGKSIIHEALEKLLTKGYVRADQALTDQSGFNGELAGAILCVVEEVDIGRSKTASNRIKDWVTAQNISIRALYQTPYHIPNSTHWIQCANDHTYCPVLPGDTRITMCYVPELEKEVPKARLLDALEKEAPDFLAGILHLEIPDSQSRLGVPIISTQDKQAVQLMNRTPLESFVFEKCRHENGRWIKFSEFFDELQKWLDPEDFQKHTKIFVGKHIPPQFPKGRDRRTAQWYLGNICWVNAAFDEPTNSKYVLINDFLTLQEQTPNDNHVKTLPNQWKSEDYQDKTPEEVVC